MLPRPSLPKTLAMLPLAALALGWAVHAADGSSPHDARLTSAGADRHTTASTSSTPSTAPTPLSLDDAIVVPPGTSAAAGTAHVANAVAAGATTADIPAVALAAYQRAAAIVDTAQPACHLDWTLLAAIGRVESDHGRIGGAQLSSAGVATPAIVGPALNGLDGATLVTDTDGGAYDGDPALDHAVGPMQLLPATWSSVGVDADGDGQRNPQDINDAALGAAVYLCSGGGDLSTPAGQQAAVFGYNHTTTYVDTVLAVAQAYQSSQATSATVQAALTRLLPPPSTPTAQPGAGGGHHRHHSHHGHHGAKPKPKPSPKPTPSPSPSAAPSSPAGSPSPTPSRSADPTPTPTPTPTQCPTASSTSSPSPTGTATGTATDTSTPAPSDVCPSDSPSTSPSASASDGASPSPTVSPASPSASVDSMTP